MYEADALPYPKANAAWQAENRTSRAMRALLDFQDHFVSEGQIREAVAQYYALTTALDENVGRVLRAIEETGAADDTLVIYASDHGDNLGNRGHWGKSTMWEESVGVPLVIAGPGITAGATSDTPVSLIDLAPTVEAAGGLPVDESLPGRDLRELARDRDPDRPVFAEYHAVGAETGIFMLRLGSYKLIEFVGDAPLLYDLEADPEELVNLAEKPDHRGALERCRAALHAICDSVAVNAQAFRDQAARVKHLGGEASVRRRQPLAFTDPSAGAYRAP
jgi:choline-sulfatase